MVGNVSWGGDTLVYFVSCVPYREKVAGDTIASIIDDAFPVLLAQHKQVATDRF